MARLNDHYLTLAAENAEEDIEYVHRARVASRRLRAALAMFRDGFDAQTWKRWRKQVQRLTGGLGEARDKDVQIEFVRGVLAGLGRHGQAAGRRGAGRLSR